MRRFGIIAACFMVLSCTDSVDRAARRAYELTLPAPSDGTGWSVRRDSSGRVATWQIRIDGSWDEYAAWVQPRLLREFDAVVATPNRGLLFRKTVDADWYSVEIRAPEPPQPGYASATFTARPF